MSAIRLRQNENRNGIEVRVDDETPISDEPVTLSGRVRLRYDDSFFLNLTEDEADQLGEALKQAAKEARDWRAGERR